MNYKPFLLTALAPFFLIASCQQLLQGEGMGELEAFEVTVQNWKRSESLPVTNMWRTDKAEVAVSPELSALLNATPLWMHYYNDTYAGWRRVLTDDAHVNPATGASLIPVSRGEIRVERIQHYRACAEDGSLLFSYKAALVSFPCPMEHKRACGEILWDLENPAQKNIQHAEYFCSPALAQKLNAVPPPAPQPDENH